MGIFCWGVFLEPLFTGGRKKNHFITFTVYKVVFLLDTMILFCKKEYIFDNENYTFSYLGTYTFAFDLVHFLKVKTYFDF